MLEIQKGYFTSQQVYFCYIIKQKQLSLYRPQIISWLALHTMLLEFYVFKIVRSFLAHYFSLHHFKTSKEKAYFHIVLLLQIISVPHYSPWEPPWVPVTRENIHQRRQRTMQLFNFTRILYSRECFADLTTLHCCLTEKS